MTSLFHNESTFSSEVRTWWSHSQKTPTCQKSAFCACFFNQFVTYYNRKDIFIFQHHYCNALFGWRNFRRRNFRYRNFRRPGISSRTFRPLNISYRTTGSGTFSPGIIITIPLSHLLISQSKALNNTFKHTPLKKPQLPFLTH